MSQTTLKGLHFVPIRKAGSTTEWYVYAWRGGPIIMRAKGAAKPGLTPEALAKFQAAIGSRHTSTEDTISGLATKWRSSAAWRGMADSTRKQWGYVLDDIEAKWGKIPLSIFDDRRIREKIVAWRDAASETPRKADYRIQVLSALLGYGRTLGKLTHNFAEGIPSLYKGGQRQEIIWLPQEVGAWQAAPVPIRDVVNLARLTGLRKGDMIALPLEAVGTHAVVWRTSKSLRRATVQIPLLPELAALIPELRARRRAPNVSTLLVNSRGEPWTANGLSSSFGDARAALGLPAKRLHDFRGTYATELCRAGLTNQEIARTMGWTEGQVDTIRRLYVDEAAVMVAIGQRIAA